jgi:hypothetical protein
MSILIHIGYPKTATTWFQLRFFPKIENFKIANRDDIINLIIRPNALSFNPKLTRTYFLNAYGSSIILSLEGFIGTTHNFGMNGYLISEHARRIYATFPEAKIILFIREQHEIIASSYYQYIVGGGTYSLKRYLQHKFFEDLNGLSLFSFSFFEYDLIINYYQSLYQKEQIFVFLYEDFKSNNRNFLENFCQTFGLIIDLTNLDYRPDKERLRIGLKYLFLIANLFTSRKMLNKYYLIHLPYWFEIYKRYYKRMNHCRIFGSRPKTHKILGQKHYQFISDYYKTSNQKLINEFGLKNITDYNYSV